VRRVAFCIALAALAASAPAFGAWASPGTEPSSPATETTRKGLWADATRGDLTLSALLSMAETVDTVVRAQAQRDEAKALAAASQRGLLPKVTPALSATGQTRVLGSGPKIKPSWSTNVSVTASHNFDLFGAGKTRAAAAQARLDIAEADLAEAQRAARLQIAQIYSAVRTVQARKAAARRGLAAADDSLLLAEARYAAGLETGLGVSQARTARDVAQATLPPLEQDEAAQIFALEAFFSVSPGALAQTFAPDGGPPDISIANTMQLPISVLASRADVRAAQAFANAAALDARADHRDKWPSLSISAILSRTDQQGATGGDPLGSLSADLLGPLFDFGRLKALAEAGDARAQAAFIALRQATNAALQDVATQRSRVENAKQRVARQQAAVASARDQVSLARARYTSGLSGFLDVLTAEQAAVSADNALALAQGEAADAAFGFLASIGAE
jgi:outer membrane protein, multidrug efflux system